MTVRSWNTLLASREVMRFTPFEEEAGDNIRAWSGRTGRTFAPERTDGNVNVFDAVSHTSGVCRRPTSA